MTLLRISRQDVVKIARQHHEVQQRLEQARPLSTFLFEHISEESDTEWLKSIESSS